MGIPRFGTIADLVAGGRSIRKGARFETGVIGDLVSGRRLRKIDDDGDDGPDGDREELRELLADCVQRLQLAYNAAADAQLKVLAALSPQARAVAEIAGDSARREYDVMLDSKFAIEKRLATIGAQSSRAVLAKGVGDTERDLATLCSHMRAVNDGQVRADEGVRRRLLAAISQAELRVAAAR